MSANPRYAHFFKDGRASAKLSAVKLQSWVGISCK